HGEAEASSSTSPEPPPAGRELVAVQQQGAALAAAAAQRHAGLAGTAARQLHRRRQRQTGTRATNRVTQRNGATVDVALLQRVIQVTQRLHGDGAEGLVDLDEVEVRRSEEHTSELQSR